MKKKILLFIGFLAISIVPMYGQFDFGNIKKRLSQIGVNLKNIQLIPKIEYPLEIGYIDIEKIRPGQVRISASNVQQKVSAAKKKGNVSTLDDKTMYKFDNNKSIIAQKDALPVILGPKEVGMVLVDGHHDVLSSIEVGAKTVPIKIVADYSDLSAKDFWQKAEKNNYIYPYDLAGKKIIPLPKNWKTLQDDPNRYFAAITARKCAKKDTPLNESTGAKYPLWVKVGKDIPFIEFMISDVLMNAGIQYKNEMGDDLESPQLVEMVKKARQALKDDPINGLKLVPNEVEYTKINNGNICGYQGEL